MNERICGKHGAYYKDKNLFGDPAFDRCPKCENEAIDEEERAWIRKEIETVAKEVEAFIRKNPAYHNEFQDRVLKALATNSDEQNEQFQRAIEFFDKFGELLEMVVEQQDKKKLADRQREHTPSPAQPVLIVDGNRKWAHR